MDYAWYTPAMGRPPTTSEYLRALGVVRAYLEHLGCSEKELGALKVLEGKLQRFEFCWKIKNNKSLFQMRQIVLLYMRLLK